MKHPMKWENNTLRRLYIVAVVPFVFMLGVFIGAFYGIKEVFSELTDSVRKLWKNPK